LGAGDAENQARQFGNGELLGVAQIHRPGHGRIDHANDPPDKVVHITEAAGLAPVTVDGQRVAVERLGDEVAHDPAIP
jgi:hypothetical protein